jgi:hypothetical protein
MPETILLHYRLTKDLWRQFFVAHFNCDRSLRLCYLWGALCIIAGSAGLGGLYPSKEVAVLFLATGFFGVLAKPILIIRSVRKAGRHPFSGKEVTVSVSPEELSVRSADAGYRQPWDNFVGYRRLDPGFLLYQGHNAFFLIPLSAMTAGYARRIEQILEAAEVPRL